MTLARDLTDLPRAEPERTEGLAPDSAPRFIGALVDAWALEHDEGKPTALGTRFRHSDAGKCARAIAYAAAGIDKSDPMDLTGVWNVRLGTMLHDAWQTALMDRYPGATVEVKVGWDDLDGSGHVDAVIVIPEGGAWHDIPATDADPGGGAYGDDLTIAYELKSIGGYGFKAAVGKARRGTPAEGPKSEHLLQAALNGLACDADEVIVGYLSKEAISVNVGAGMTDLARFAAEWTFDRDTYEPLALAEKARIGGILELVDKGELAARKIPDLPRRAEITDPSRGMWVERDADGTIVDTGSWWACGYCSYRSVCATTEAGRIPVESVVKIGGEA